MSLEYVWNSFREADGQLHDGERRTEGAVLQHSGPVIWMDLVPVSLTPTQMEMGPSLYHKLEQKNKTFYVLTI